MPVVFTTGYSEAASEARAEGFTLLSKPYAPDDLVAALDTAAATRPDNVVALPRSRA